MLYKDDTKAQERRKRTYYNHREENIRKTAEWRKANRDKRNANQRIYNANRRRTDPEFKERENARSARSYARYRERRLILAYKYNHSDTAKARQAVQDAVRNGSLFKPSKCSICNSAYHIQAHHNDYSTPLIVEWLCAFCHGAKHQTPT